MAHYHFPSAGFGIGSCCLISQIGIDLRNYASIQKCYSVLCASEKTRGAVSQHFRKTKTELSYAILMKIFAWR
ncbi:hypothetical protein CUJ84_pRLN5000146 (plasmid) [Rhizobium leguminosarum]|uniref:Uncharacterized protein n=1 Tax=Rhizobium leguminosarum TaxID=384 RepID=A0A2K9ZIX0_RHILE|nr:hypothetical protein CUJ84_pRLN5000146 [Rhizobium leguminosarum]